MKKILVIALLWFVLPISINAQFIASGYSTAITPDTANRAKILTRTSADSLYFEKFTSQSLSATGTATNWNSVVTVGSALANVTTLPVITTADIGKYITIKNVSTGVNTQVAPAGAVMVGGASLSNNEAITFYAYDLTTIQAISRIAANGVEAWSTTGNTSTAAKILGSTDNTAVKLQSGTANLTINEATAGNVGIGTSTPTTKLDVNGEIKGTRLIANGAGAITSNVAVGGSSLIANTTGANNTAVGFQALFGATTASNSVAIGGNALQAITTGNNNVAIGSQALRTNTIGSSNIAVGGFALVSGTGSSNIAIGHNSALAATSAIQNVTIGGNALANNTTGANNTVIGHNTGAGIITGGSNTIIGANVTGLASGLSGNIIIADGSGNQRINVDATGNVGMGITTPTTKLHIVSTATSLMTAEGNNTNAIIEINNTNASATNYTGVRMNKNGVEQWLIGTSGVNANGDFAIRRPGLVPFTILQSNGNIGINTTTPTAKLHVNGTFTTETSLVKSNQTANFAISVADVDAASMILYNQSTAGISITSIAAPATATLGRFLRIHNFGTAALTYLGDVINPNTFLDLQWASGTWAKETSNSSSLPSVNGGLLFGNGTTQVQDATNLFYDDTNNRFGIGTTTPTSKFTVVGSEAGTFLNIAAATTLGEQKYVWAAGATTYLVTLPAASTCTGRIYSITNTQIAKTISTYTTLANVASTTLPLNTTITLVSTGAVWKQF